MDINITLAMFGVVAGLATSFLCGWYFATRKRSIHKKLKELDSHVEYISKLRKSSVELHRRAYTTIFLILLCLSTALGAPIISKFIAPNGSLDQLSSVFQLSAFLTSIVISFSEFRAYGDISNYQKALARIDQKKQRLTEKLNLM